MRRLSRIRERARRTPTLTRWDSLAIFAPAVAWLAIFRSRGHWIHTYCAPHPELCGRDTVFGWDRFAIDRASERVDAWSFVTQNGAGILAFGLPLLIVLWRLSRRRRPFADRATGHHAKASPAQSALIQLSMGWLLLFQATVWNGFTNELVRLIVQRPRPFVYLSPATLGSAPAHYTSFYSGHTSFAAVAGVSLVFSLIALRLSARAVVLWGSLAGLLVILTGVFRVMAGRHFMTDVIAGALVGGSIAGVVALAHRPARGKRSSSGGPDGPILA